MIKVFFNYWHAFIEISFCLSNIATCAKLLFFFGCITYTKLCICCFKSCNSNIAPGRLLFLTIGVVIMLNQSDIGCLLIDTLVL